MRFLAAGRFESRSASPRVGDGQRLNLPTALWATSQNWCCAPLRDRPALDTNETPPAIAGAQTRALGGSTLERFRHGIFATLHAAMAEPSQGYRIQYTLVDSIATERIPHCCSQSANAFRSRVNVGKLRTGCWSRSALTATNNSLAPTSIPAASGCRIGNSSHRLFDLFAIGSSELPVGCPRRDSKANSQSRSSSRTTHVITSLCANLGPTLPRQASIANTNVAAGCSCHPTDAKHHRSTHVPFHPVWPTPAARFPVPIRPTSSKSVSGRRDEALEGVWVQMTTRCPRQASV